MTRFWMLLDRLAEPWWLFCCAVVGLFGLCLLILAGRDFLRLWQDDPEIGYELKTWPWVLWLLLWDRLKRLVNACADRLPVDDAEPESIHDGKRWGGNSHD